MEIKLSRDNYFARSLGYGGGADLFGPLDMARRDVLENWDPDVDIVVFNRLTESNSVISGFLGFNREVGKAYWIIGDVSGPVRTVSFRTGRLGKKMPAPKGVREYIRRQMKSRRY